MTKKSKQKNQGLEQSQQTQTSGTSQPSKPITQVTKTQPVDKGARGDVAKPSTSQPLQPLIQAPPKTLQQQQGPVPSVSCFSPVRQSYLYLHLSGMGPKKAQQLPGVSQAPAPQQFKQEAPVSKGVQPAFKTPQQPGAQGTAAPDAPKTATGVAPGAQQAIKKERGKKPQSLVKEQTPPPPAPVQVPPKTLQQQQGPAPSAPVSQSVQPGIKTPQASPAQGTPAPDAPKAAAEVAPGAQEGKKKERGKKAQSLGKEQTPPPPASVAALGPVKQAQQPQEAPTKAQQGPQMAPVQPSPPVAVQPELPVAQQAPPAAEGGEAFPSLKAWGPKKPQQQPVGSQAPAPPQVKQELSGLAKLQQQMTKQPAMARPKAQQAPVTQPQAEQLAPSQGAEQEGATGKPLSHPGNDKFEFVPAKQSYKYRFEAPPRPGYGREGRPIRLQANHFKLNVALNNIYHYDIALTPNKLPKRINRIIFEDLVASNRDGCFKNVAAAYDGSKSFYTVQRLPFNEIALSQEMMLEERKMDYKAKIQFAAEVNLFQLQEFWEGRSTEMPMDAIQAIDVAMKHNANLREIPAGRSLYSMPETFRDLGEGCELWMGRFQSVRPTQWKMTLNIDMAATAFYQPLPVIEFMNKFLKSNQPITALRDFDRMKLQKEMKNLKVRVDHQGSIKRTYVVRGLTKVPATQIKFTMERDGKQETMTVADYFHRQYNKRLRFPNLPCLHVGNPQKQIYLPLEVCTLKEGQKKNNQVSDLMVANMIRHTALPAPERKQKILQSVQKANFNGDPLMRAFGISVDDRLLEMDGRVIEPPTICYVEQAQTGTVFPSRGVWDMRKGQKFLRGAEVSTWALICFEGQNRCPNDALRDFFSQLSKTGQEMGMAFNPKPSFTTYARDASQAESIFSGIVRETPGIQLVLVILPGRSHIYGEIKRLGDVVFGVLTQCIQSKNVTRFNHSLLINICLKVNVKCEGLNNVIQCPAKVALFKDPVIVFGADVTHPMPGDTNMPSIAAVVGSMDCYPQKYTACVKAQGHRVEIIENLAEMVGILLRRFFRQTRAKPRKIIFYRDGVSEGQFLQVLQYELAAIQKACTALERDYQPTITFAVVQKRHHTRLFCANPRDQVGKSGNIPPGTIVDKGIVHPREFDFFLCSHAGIQGTSRPTHYHILWDDNNFTADQFQSFTYALCHTYVRCNRAVSIPAPAYYAHHVAFRARYHLGDLHSDTHTTSSTSEPIMNLESINKAITIQDEAAQRMYFA